MIPRMKALTTLVAALLLLAACGSDEEVEVIDMNKVLEIFDQVSTTPVPGAEAPGGTDATTGTEGVEPLEQPDAQKTKAFLTTFTEKLNAAKLINAPIRAQMMMSGGIEGYRDRDGNGTKDSRDEQLFILEIDPENKRVIATQTVAKETYRRDHYYRHHHYHGGYYGYWMMGSMWGRQRSYYSSPGRTRPSYSRMQMSDRNYHSRATTKARSASRSARSRGGSRGFRGGK